MTGQTTNTGKAFADTAELQAQNLKSNTVARLITGERYAIGVDGGNGLPLASGNFANLLADVVTSIAVNTILVPGKNYLSTVTKTHTVPAASGGDSIKITWLEGTIMTLTSASNILVTKDVTTSDTTWVFENFIQDLTLVDNGTAWEIK